MTCESWTYHDLRAPYWRLYWNESEGASITVAGKRRDLEPGVILLIPPETSFSSRSEKAVRHFYVHFLSSRIWMRSGVEALPVSPSTKKLLKALCTDGLPTAEWRVLGLVAECLARLPEEGWQTFAPPEARIREALLEIDSNLPFPRSVDALARAAGMNVNAFIRLFRERIGETPARYMRERRMEMACLMLHHTSTSIEEVAAACAYCDRYHFTRTFIRSRGISPAAFRRQAQHAGRRRSAA